MGRFGVNREFAECDRCGHPRMARFGGGCYCGCTGSRAAHQASTSVATESDDVVAALQAQVAAANCGQRGARELVTAAARLRGLDHADEALATAKRAKEAAATPAEETAAATLVVACLCDLWGDEEARREGESALQNGSSPFLLRALARAWFLGFVATGTDDFRSQAHEYFRRADELEAVAAVTPR